jgi:hypothetical protein
VYAVARWPVPRHALQDGASPDFSDA